MADRKQRQVMVVEVRPVEGGGYVLLMNGEQAARCPTASAASLLALGTVAVRCVATLVDSMEAGDAPEGDAGFDRAMSMAMEVVRGLDVVLAQQEREEQAMLARATQGKGKFTH